VFANMVSKKTNLMHADSLSDLETAVLCDLLAGPGANLKAHKRAVLDQLVAKGLVEPIKDEPARFQLSDKAHSPPRGAWRRNKRWLSELTYNESRVEIRLCLKNTKALSARRSMP
jgi:hypothetical protein